MKIGSGVDTILSFGMDKFNELFSVPARRNLKNPPEGITELTQAQYDDIVEMARVLMEQPFYQEIKDYRKQEIIKYDINIGEHFCGLAAIPDFFKIENGVCDIVDLKTAADADERKYFYKCLDFGYFRQFAVMTIILSHNLPEIKEFNYWHYVVEKNTSDNLFIPFLYRLANERVDWHIKEVNELIIPAIKSEKEFKQVEVSRDSAILIGGLNEEE
jgi:hypothetical protein